MVRVAPPTPPRNEVSPRYFVWIFKYHFTETGKSPNPSVWLLLDGGIRQDSTVPGSAFTQQGLEYFQGEAAVQWSANETLLGSQWHLAFLNGTHLEGPWSPLA